MVRASFSKALITALLFIAGTYAIINLFIDDKSWLKLALAGLGAVFIPIAATLFVRMLPKPQPISKTIVITGIWVAWFIAIFMSVLVIWADWSSFWPQKNQNFCLDYCPVIQNGTDLNKPL